MTPEFMSAVSIAAAVVGIWLFIALSGAVPLWALWRATTEELDEESTEAALTAAMEHGVFKQSWARDHDFEPCPVFVLRSAVFSPIVVGWRRRDEPTFLCTYVLNGGVIASDIVTEFEGDSCLTTATTKDGHQLPPAENTWLQSFSVTDPNTLWAHHQAAVAYLMATRGATYRSGPLKLQEEILAFFHSQQAYFATVPLWWLRLPYWYFFRRNILHNQTVQELDARRR